MYKLGLWSVVILCGLNAQAAPSGLSVEVGQRKRVAVQNAAGVIISAPKLADVRMLGRGEVELEGKAPGSARLEIWTHNAERVEYSLEVRPSGSGKAPAKEEAAYDFGWPRARFGGVKIPDAVCELPFNDARADQLFEDAQRLLKRDEISAAIRRLEELIKLEPAAATPHLFLGAALARTKNPMKGAAAFETFVLSCEEDPRTPMVVEVLKQYQSRPPSSKATPPRGQRRAAPERGRKAAAPPRALRGESVASA